VEINVLLNEEEISFKEYTETGFKFDADEINKKYENGELRIITEQGRYPLQNILEILSKNIKFDPTYQRRRVWNNAQKSRLIESFIMNVPIPPVFLYEIEYSKYEVMDGLQRLSTLYEFYSNKFRLSGLTVWQELNGLTYSELPEQIKRGIDRRYISTYVVLKETAKNEEDELMLKTYVFERLNTGGTQLTDQETRNALYDGKMNFLTKKIAKDCKVLHKLWNLKPINEEDLISQDLPDEVDSTDAELDDKKILIRMEDIELVLRYFAYRQIESNPAVKVKALLDLYLRKANEQYDEQILQDLEELFYAVHDLAYKLFGKSAFYMYTKNKNDTFSWKNRPSKMVYDPMMYVLSEYVQDEAKKKKLIENKDGLKIALENMFRNSVSDFNGRNNNKSDVIRRIELFRLIFNDILGI
jgi:hypothetical protein